MAKRSIFSQPVFSLRRSLRPLISLVAVLCLASVMLIGITPVYGEGNTKHVTIIVNFQGLGKSQSAALISGGKIVDRCVSKDDTQKEEKRRITGNLRGVGVMFSVRFFPQGNCQGKATTSVRLSTPVGGTVTCTADNANACKLAESESEKIVTVLFQRNGFTDGSKSARLFIDRKPYGGCITYTTAVTGPSDNTFEVRFFSNADCTGTQRVKGPFNVEDGRTVSCVNVNNCKLK